MSFSVLNYTVYLFWVTVVDYFWVLRRGTVPRRSNLSISVLSVRLRDSSEERRFPYSRLVVSSLCDGRGRPGRVGVRNLVLINIGTFLREWFYELTTIRVTLFLRLK